LAHKQDDPRRLFTEEYMQLSMELSETSWNRILPWNGEEIIEAVALATVHDFDGDLDSLLSRPSPDEPVRSSDLLDWESDLDPLDGMDPADEEERREQRELDEQRRALFASVLIAANRPVPGTVAELAELLVGLGVLTHHAVPDDGHRWRVAAAVPEPAEVLPMPPEWVQQDQKLRRDAETGPAVSALLSHCNLYAQAPLLTTIDRLSGECRYSPERIRAGLVSLIDSGDIRVDRRVATNDFQPADLNAVAIHARVLVTVDWNHVAATRMTFQLTMPTAG
jgi:hypothetical protein